MTDSIFISKETSSWIENASKKPTPSMLFSELWFEGELCILYADTNLGKSILAIQIADSISRGLPINGFKLEAETQRVLYFDFELSAKQLENRYSDEYENHYSFHSNLIRSEINLDNEELLTEELLNKALEEEIAKQKAKIIIIDNITYLNQDNEKAKFALSLMKHLKTLKSKHSLSILILAHTPKREFNRPITNNDLQGSKMLINFCDSAFAIGKSYKDNSLRYIKQIKQRNCEQVYDQDNVCVCKITKGFNNNFLQFVFQEYGEECKHLNVANPTEHQERKQEAIRLKGEGWTNIKIGEKFGVSEGAVRKWLK